MWGGSDDIFATLNKKLESDRGQTAANIGGSRVGTNSGSGINKCGDSDNSINHGHLQRSQHSKQEVLQGPSTREAHAQGRNTPDTVAHKRATADGKLQQQRKHGRNRFELGEVNSHVNSGHLTVKSEVAQRQSVHQKGINNYKKGAEKSLLPSKGARKFQEESNSDRNRADERPQTGGEHKRKQNFGRKPDFRRNSEKNHDQKFESRKQHVSKMSYLYLKNLSEKTPVEITFHLERDSQEFQELLQKRDNEAAIVFLTVIVLSKVCTADLVHLKSSVLHVACKPDFLDELTKFIVVHLPRLKSQEEIIAFCESSIIFFNTVIKLFSISSVSDFNNIKKVLSPLLITMVEIEENFKGTDTYKSMHDEVKTLLDQVNTASEMLNSNNNDSNYQTRQDKLFDLYESNFDRQPRDNFRSISHLPTAKEILSCSHSIVYRNKVKGSYKSVEHYLEVQYRLLREDFVGPLREGIQEYIDSVHVEVGRRKRRFNNVRIYPQVRFLNSTLKDNKFGFVINYDVTGQFKRVNWEFSKRFIFGSLLLFTTDNFKSFFAAKVLERDIDTLKKGNLYIEIAPEAKLPDNLMSQEFVMAESEVYFEPYYNVLIALQLINEDNFPMKRYIIDTEKDALLPAYLNDKMRQYKIGKFKVKIGNNFDNFVGDPDEVFLHVVGDSDNEYYYYDEHHANWPSAEDLHMDISQYGAFKAALTSEFVAIQGPPGTGKTYLGLRIAQVLLSNLNSELFPILVVCYTNHALDQFLEGILKYTESIVRIGGRSQSEVLNEYNLRNFRFKNRGFNKGVQFAVTRRTLSELQEMCANIISLDSMLQEKMFYGILSINTFEHIMNPRQYEKLKDRFAVWLMEGSLEFYAPGHNEMLQQDNSKQEDEIENVGEDGQAETENVEETGAKVDNGEKINSEEIVEDEVAVNTDNQDNGLEEEEEEEDEVSKLRKNEVCIDFDPEIDLNPSLVNAKHPNLCLQLSTMYDQIGTHKNSLDELNYYANQGYSENFVVPEQLMNEYLDVQKQLRDAEVSYSYLRKRLTEKVNFNLVHERQLYNVEDVFILNSNERWALYHWWLQRLFDSFSVKVKEYEEKYRELYLKHLELKQLEDVEGLKHVKVIGMTTTGAASRRTMIENLNTRIVIVEEAAEVLEAHIVTALTKKCEHVILIGDHKQLRPSPAVYTLAKHFHLDVSLFERMLNNGLNCHTLGVQHRMLPEIASLIVPAIYPRLENHMSVHGRTKIKGVTSNLFFITHTHYEDEVEDSLSKMNTFEADFLIRLCKHFLYQGYAGEEITILATYSGQMNYMRRKKRGDPMLKNVRIIVVDNFQGEENKIILLSLVRSNAGAKIGFLGTENRVCVALSRARDGMYIIGNMDNLTESSRIWKKIKAQLENLNALGPALTLECLNHKKTMRVSSAVDFKVSPEGGCTEPCDAILPCGHKCPRNCHVLDSDHTTSELCTQPCRKFCARGLHKCWKRCCDDCGQCQIKVEYVLDCKHKNLIPCHIDPSNYKCVEIVTESLPLCGHENNKMCYLDICKVICRIACEDRLPCGHSCVQKCHKTEDPDHIQYKCRKQCTKKSKDCTENHTCAKLCFEECGTCVVIRVKELPCGHMMKMECSADVNSVKCRKRCMKTLPCGHPCTSVCSDPCADCQKIVKKVLPECGHQVETKCSVEPLPSACKSSCERTLKCGHKCKCMCKDDCDESKCQVLVESLEIPACSHPAVMVPCCENKKGVLFQNILEQYCKQECKAALDCGHQCEGDCSSCMQGRIHVPCTVKRSKTLVCGHIFELECNENITYCYKNCMYRCHHSQCEHKCGFGCEKCLKPCGWSCEHVRCRKKCFEICDRKPCNEPCPKKLACQHPCIGFCGEVCPKLCRECDKDKLAKIYVDFERKPDARFVVLEDCNDCVEVEELEKHLKINGEDEDKEIFLRKCPICSVPINKTRRYTNEVKTFYQQLVKLRQKVICDTKEVKILQKQLTSRLQDIKNLKSPAQTHVQVLASHKILEGKKAAVQDETLAVCFVSEILLLLSEKYSMLMMSGRTGKVMRDAITVKLSMVISVLKLRMKRFGITEMVSITNEVHRVLRLMEFVILMNMGSESDSDVDYMTAMELHGYNDVMFSLNQYSLKDDDRVKDVLNKINENNVRADLRASVISTYKLCVSQIKCLSLCEVQWAICSKDHPYIVRTFDDIVLRCECNQDDKRTIEILMHMSYSSENHRNNNFNRNNKQSQDFKNRSRSSSVASEASSNLNGQHSFHGNSRGSKGRNQFSKYERGVLDYGQRGGYRNDGFNPPGNVNNNSGNNPSLLGMPPVVVGMWGGNRQEMGGYNRGRGRGGRRGKHRRWKDESNYSRL